MKIKVALLHFGFKEYTTELANGLVNYVDLTLIQQEKNTQDCREVLDPRISVLTFKKPDMRYPSNILAMKEMMRLIRKVQPDILHVQEINDIWYLLTTLFNQIPPLVTTIHDISSHPGDGKKVFGSDYTRPIAFYRSQQLIVHTQQQKTTLNQKFSIPNEKVTVLPHGEIGSWYKRHKHNNSAPKEPYTLLFFGRIWPYKGLKYLLEAMPLIAEQIPEIKLIIAGRGENMEQYFPDGYDPQRYDILNHFITNQDVISLFQRSTITILPYIEASQSGVAAVSYGMGTPVIAFDVGGLSEIVHHQEDGLLVPLRNVKALAEAIISLLKNQELYNQMRKKIMARCQEDLNWKNIAEQTVEVYHRLSKTK
ncbi:glycosyltransferase family 4 protein [Nodularia harveyana UHCC-0300]|uniref:Glycosyltransferase family 4 protein n=1 Tax=Nodularia harveyana UHCC-0300 TaxID=2974287 RepID=A0ABU5UCU6_9CYAN|nr:glycosyltransferase family 4 protein [Nodularia harveyana]MEA5580246.1 glycosyltransferase family 4 protein [Nodularia harveyana UHCC-0300]